jgi:hypothetical protein
MENEEIIPELDFIKEIKSQAIADRKIATQRLNDFFTQNKENFEKIRQSFELFAEINAPIMQESAKYRETISHLIKSTNSFRKIILDNKLVFDDVLKKCVVPNFKELEPIIKNIKNNVEITRRTYNKPDVINNFIHPKITQTHYEDKVLAKLEDLIVQMKNLIAENSQTKEEPVTLNNKKLEKSVFNIDCFSHKNLIRIKKILAVVLDELEIQGVNRLIGNKISLKILERENIFSNEAETVLNKINCVKVLNKDLKLAPNSTYCPPAIPPLYTEKEINENLFLLVNNSVELKNIFQQVNNKINESEKNKKIIKNESKKEIKKITIIKMNNGGYFFAVNDDYDELRPIKNNGKYWPIFIDEIDQRDVKPETRQNVKVISREMVDYFNYNSRCPVYMGGKYALTDIFTGKGVDTIISPDIKTKLITEKQYSIIRSRKRKK